MMKILFRNYIYVLFSYLRIKSLYYLARVYVHAYDSENSSDPQFNGEYKYLRKNAKQFNIAFDVGANNGDYTNYIHLLNPTATIHSFEPDPISLSKIRNKYLFPEHIYINAVGLGEQEGELTLFQGDVFSSFHPSEYNKQGTITVKVTTIDNYCLSNQIDIIDFIKIDVEGHELAVLKGAVRMLKENRIKVIQFEYGFPSVSARIYIKDIFDFIESKNPNVKFYKLGIRGLIRIDKYDELFEKIDYANFIIKFT